MAITLSDIRAAADEKFKPAPVDLEDGKDPVQLVNPLRLDKKKRDRLTSLGKDIEDGDAVEVVSRVLADAASTPADGKRLVAAANGDIAVLMAILDAWIEESNLGEAASSEG